MKRQFGPVLAVLLLFCAPALWAQSGSTDSGSSSDGSSSSSGSVSSSGSGSTTDGSGGGTSTSTSPYQSPYPDPSQAGSSDSQSSDSSSDNSQQSGLGPQATFNHPEQLPALSEINDVTRNTGIRLSLTSGSLTDYIWGGSNQPRYWQNIGMWSGGIGISQLRSTSLIQFNYTGGVSLSSLTLPHVSNYTTLTQTGSAKILWNFAKRWQLRIKDNYLYSDNPFEPFLTYTSDPTPNNPNPTFFFPQAIIETNVGSMDVSYRLSEHDSLTFNGGESFQKYIRGITGLWNSYTYSGGGFYQHVLNPQMSAGMGYTFSALDFGHGESRAGVNMVETFITYKFNPGFSVSAWVGPEITNTKDLVPIFCTPYGCLIEELHQTQVDVAEGGTVSYLHSGNAVRFQFSHRVSDGGGILGAINLYQATLAYSRQLTRVWGFAAAMMYDNSTSILSSQAAQYWNAAQATINFNRHFGESWDGAVYLLFINQAQNFYGTPGTTNAAGVGLTLRYLWGHSLGR